MENNKKRWTEPEILKCIIKNTPLIAIDFLIKNKEGKFLLGLRKNRPAKGYYFVPGGRIFKNETIENAFKGISKNEIGIELDIENAKFLGVYEHIYKDNYFGNEYGTHYIVLAFLVDIDSDLPLPDEQHSDYIWLTPEEILKHEKVHEYTKNYFKKSVKRFTPTITYLL